MLVQKCDQWYVLLRKSVVAVVVVVVVVVVFENVAEKKHRDRDATEKCGIGLMQTAE